jgi:hypothetical protein
MKKIILATALILTTGVLSSQIKTNNMPFTTTSMQKFNISSELKNLASAD